MVSLKNNVQINAGDIVLMSTNTAPGLLIKIGTVSTITHVALAISHSEVLESTPDKTNQDLRKVPISIALKDANSAVVFKRRPPLNQDEIDILERKYLDLKKHPKKSRYHIGIAGAAGVPAIVNVVSIVVISGAIVAQVVYGGALPYLAFMVPLAIWGLPIVRKVGRALSKSKPDNCLTKELEGSYCSGFVAKLEEEIKSDIWKFIDKKPYDPRPKDIAYACRKHKMQWIEYKFKETPTLVGNVFRALRGVR
ncbi:hypothetical protein L1D15_11250 [Vibrio sp. Isolate25]|uniref:hypothetical protein n=1 Tax=Vibrio sp. Isolate25 TaxID=2908535 RepID=UPI001EFCBC5D|nr:hypothetical protein [Vibrio sp. Isolate25]MCG9597291.1 hypothetical protein [Vibrio sp. Isolate25]